MGSGKERERWLTSEFPFAKIVGVELPHHLHKIAEETSKFQSCASPNAAVNRTGSLHR
jgi:hypothetical protein